tara:strand:- start:135 stop:284 length:150 start_codon:yes stop_codon:yes gene_type:complete
VDILFTIVASVLLVIGFFVICKPRYLSDDSDDDYFDDIKAEEETSEKKE